MGMGIHSGTGVADSRITLIDFHTHIAPPQGVYTPQSFGLHPWHISNDYRNTPPGLFEQAQIIGECGLDRCCSTPWELQHEAFCWQLEMAARYGKPVVIHCVRAFNELVELRKRYDTTPWVVHGYIGAPQMAVQLNGMGIKVSLGAALLDPSRSKPRQTLLRLGADNILLETDTATCGIGTVYGTAASLLGITVPQLAEKISVTCSMVLGLQC